MLVIRGMRPDSAALNCSGVTIRPEQQLENLPGVPITDSLQLEQISSVSISSPISPLTLIMVVLV